MNIKEIPKEGKKLNIKKDSAWFMNMVGDSNIDIEFLAEDMTSNLDVHLTQTRSIVIEGSIYADVVLQCVKCLSLFHKVVDTTFTVVLEPYDLSAPIRHAIAKAELDAEFYVNDEFDPEVVVFEQIMLNLPMYPLCKPDCKGLCMYCGANLNEEPSHNCNKGHNISLFRSQLERIIK
ncbi:MAG: YceD family protein [bacterium]